MTISVIQDKHQHVDQERCPPTFRLNDRASTGGGRLVGRRRTSPPPPAAAATTTLLTAVNHNDLIYIIVDNEISQIGTKLTKYCCFGK